MISSKLSSNFVIVYFTFVRCTFSIHRLYVMASRNKKLSLIKTENIRNYFTSGVFICQMYCTYLIKVFWMSLYKYLTFFQSRCQMYVCQMYCSLSHIILSIHLLAIRSVRLILRSPTRVLKHFVIFLLCTCILSDVH
jgi:hypothetical protein